MGTPAYGEVAGYINKNLLWDPNRILNIWVNDEIYGTNAYAPAYILDNGTAVPGLKMNSVATADEVSFTSYKEVGITLTVGSIFSINKGGYEYYLGTHFGLMPTVFSTYSGIPFVNGDVDFCSDTYTYELGPIALEKNTYSDDKQAPVIYYNSCNIMDGSSASTSLTYEQVLHITAFEVREEGRELLEKNSRKFGTPGITGVIGDFTEADLSVYPVPDAVFIGGHGGKLARILTILAGIMPVGGIVVFNSVSEESLNLFRQEAVRSGFRLTDECRIAVDDHNPITVLKACAESYFKPIQA